MSNVFDIALFGMQAAQTGLNVAAGNLANSDTPGYKAARADIVELSGGGAGVGRISRDPTPGPIGPDGKEGSNVDLANESINLTRAKVLYKANAMVVKMASRMTGSLLDIMDTDRKRR